MSNETFETALKIVSKWEGGWSDHKNDPGGATKFGITQKVLSSWRKRAVLKIEVSNLTYAEAKEIYHSLYWKVIKADTLPPSIAIAMFDCAVNQGPNRAIVFLQKALKKLAAPNLTVDGKLGQQTANVIAVLLTRPELEEQVLRDFVVHRALHYSSLTKLLTDFGLGWFRRLFDVFYRASQYLTKSNL